MREAEMQGVRKKAEMEANKKGAQGWKREKEREIEREGDYRGEQGYEIRCKARYGKMFRDREKKRESSLSKVFPSISFLVNSE